MLNRKALLTLFPIVFILAPFLVLYIIIYALGLTILNTTRQSASIAASQLMDGGVSLSGIQTGVIVLGAFQLILIIGLGFMAIGSRDGAWWLFVLFMGLLVLLLMVPSEAIFLKFITCFNFYNNAIVIARSSLAIILACLLSVVPLLCFLYTILNDSPMKCDLKLFVIPLLVIPALAILGMNIVLINQLGAPLGQDIQPSNINMGFFNDNEISSIQNENYTKENTYDQRLVGTLSQILRSSDKTFSYR